MFDYSGWQPITDLPKTWQELSLPELRSFEKVWADQSDSIRNSGEFSRFLDRLRRQAAIETGIIERLYTIDRGITQMLIERGIEEALIPHGAAGQSPANVVAMIRSQEKAIQSLLDFVGGQRTLSTSYIKELHALLTEHQKTVEKRDQFGKIFQTELLRGEWKKQPNNPQRQDGQIHLYCPPEQTASQMDQLIKWHREHMEVGVPAEVESAWLHHRFTQIHPFEDGNGRVARLLASLVFIRFNWFPLVIRSDEERDQYLDALEKADQGELKELISLFATAEKRAFNQAMSLAEQTRSEHRTAAQIVKAAASKLQKERQTKAHRQNELEQTASKLFQVVQTRFNQQKNAIESALRDIAPDLRLAVSAASSLANAPEAARANYNRYQIIETANALDYYANLTGYKSWIKLVLNQESRAVETEILVSLHPLGHEYNGLIVCSACTYHKVESQILDLQPLSDAPFQLTEYDSFNDVSQRFSEWLERALETGLKFWYDSL